ncbi:MAG: hypothetical protein JWM39_629 [Parcubacteria group bacterium]|nr:hypothetical protein [Parcubacteria group bacterium]
MNKYFVLFGIPAASIQEWMTNVDEATRKEQMDKMMIDWETWMTAHADAILDKGLPLGKTKRVDANGVSDIKNDLNWYLLVQAESHEAAAAMFVGHPHLVEIPSAYAEIMDANRMGM